MRSWLAAIVGAIVVLGIAAAGLLYVYWDQFVPIAALGINYVRYMSAPAGTIATEANPAWKADAAAPAAPAPGAASGADSDWPSYNKTLTSNRFSGLDQINRGNAGKLKVLCTYDTGQYTGFTSGLLEVNGALIFATEYDIFSIDPATCHENWRAHEDYQPATPQGVNRGAAYIDGLIFRGTQDGRVLAYDFKTGKRVWATSIADPSKGESAPAAPIAWNGLVFIGNAGGDLKGVKGRMYALDAKTGKIVWEFYLVPKGPNDPTRGPEAKSPLDSATWESTNPGIPITGGATWTSYTLDPATGLLYVPGGNPAPDFAAELSARVESLYRIGRRPRRQDRRLQDPFQARAEGLARLGRLRRPCDHPDGGRQDTDVGRAEGRASLRLRSCDQRAALPRAGDAHGECRRAVLVGKPVHFCPGSTGGAEWNGPAYDPRTNLVIIGEVEWCTTVTLQPAEKIAATKPGEPWSGEASLNPFNTWGKRRPGVRLGGLGLRRRRRHGRVEMAGEDQLSDPERHDADGRRRRVLRRHGRQFLCARRRQRPETVGPEDRRRDRRRRDHLSGRRQAEGRRRDRPDRSAVADRNHHRQGVGAGGGVAGGERSRVGPTRGNSAISSTDGLPMPSWPRLSRPSTRRRAKPRLALPGKLVIS